MLIRSGPVRLLSGPPVPSQELNQGILVKYLGVSALRVEGIA